jgi:hypothetical protein
MLPSNKRLKIPLSKRPMRLPNGYLAPWVFSLIKHWGKPAVIDLMEYRIRKGKFTWSPFWR